MSLESKQRQVVRLGRIEISEEQLGLIVDNAKVELGGCEGFIVDRARYGFHLVRRISDKIIKQREYHISREGNHIYLDPELELLHKDLLLTEYLYNHFDKKLKVMGQQC